MFIEKLRLQNFRSIPRLTLSNLHRLNCFLGPHNSGKSNILDGISIFWDAYTRAQVQRNQLKTSLGQEVQQAPPILSYIGKINVIRGLFELKVVKGIDTWRENSYLRENFVSTTFIHTQKRSHDIFNSFLDSLETMVNPSTIKALKFDMTLSQDQLMFIKQNCFLRLNNDELIPFQSENLPIIQQAIGSAFIRRFHEKSYHEFLKESITRLIKNRNYEAITAIENFLKEVIGQVFVFELGQEQEIEVTIEHAFTSPLWRISTSVIRMIALAYLLTANPINQIILLDNPSLHLHPKGERKLARKLVDFSTDHQLFFSTHSTRLLVGHAYLVDLIKGWTKVRPIKGEKSMKKVVKLLGIRPSDSFGADVVVFVEGRTDARVFRVFEDLILGDRSRNLNNRVSYIGVGGWTNMKFVLSIELLKSKFVRSRALAITDGDIADSKDYLKIKKNWNSIFPDKSFFSLKENSIESLFINNPRVFLRAFPKKNEYPSINEIQEFIKRNRERGVSDKNITREILGRYGGKRYGSSMAELLAKKFILQEIPEYLIKFYNEFILPQA